jgi:hypothetical protein
MPPSNMYTSPYTTHTMPYHGAMPAGQTTGMHRPPATAEYHPGRFSDIATAYPSPAPSLHSLSPSEPRITELTDGPGVAPYMGGTLVACAPSGAAAPVAPATHVPPTRSAMHAHAARAHVPAHGDGGAPDGDGGDYDGDDGHGGGGGGGGGDEGGDEGDDGEPDEPPSEPSEPSESEAGTYTATDTSTDPTMLMALLDAERRRADDERRRSRALERRLAQLELAAASERAHAAASLSRSHTEAMHALTLRPPSARARARAVDGGPQAPQDGPHRLLAADMAAELLGRFLHLQHRVPHRPRRRPLSPT